MRCTLSALKMFLDTTCSVTEIAETLTAIGLEVEAVIDRREELKDFEVARILSIRPHPSADKLKICEVETKDGIVQIVCGASNARKNIKVVLAKIGALIPKGKFKIKESLIRGEKSCGMLCSEDELLLGSDSFGIIELPEHAKLGEPLVKYFGLDDPIFDINVTPNRGDALSAYGIARDLAAKAIGTLVPLQTPSINTTIKSNFILKVEDKTNCPLFSIREIRNLQNKPSPDWLKQLLQNIGLKPISAIVDITNYICHIYGQPMHAYDKDKLSDNLIVESLPTKTQFIALNGKEYELEPEDLVIRDKHNIQGLAGIIGGENSSCTLSTQNIVLEAACFTPSKIARVGRRLHIDTDSRYRFERQVNQSFTIKTLDLASQMIMSICGGEASQIIYEGETNPVPNTMEFSCDYLYKLAGVNLSATDISQILERLGFNSIINGSNLTLTVPAWRHDIQIKEDIVEEIVRIYGYEKLEEIKLPEMGITKIIRAEYRRISDIKRILASCGYDEVVTNSFMDSSLAKLFVPLQDSLCLINPISSDLDYMRPSIIPNLLKLISKNLTRSIHNIALFEVGPIFPKLEEELNYAAGVRCGEYAQLHPYSPARSIDVFDIKADVERVLGCLGLVIDKCQYEEASQPYYHPTKSTTIKLGSSIIGYFGQVHPLILKSFDITNDIFAFELNIANIPLIKEKFGKRDEFLVSDFQSVNRDYAFIIALEQPVQPIISYIKNLDKKLIKSVNLFDIYIGDKLPAQSKSVAIRVQIQAVDRTLQEEELTSLSKDIITAVEQKFHAKLRE